MCVFILFVLVIINSVSCGESNPNYLPYSSTTRSQASDPDSNMNIEMEISAKQMINETEDNIKRVDIDKIFRPKTERINKDIVESENK